MNPLQVLDELRADLQDLLRAEAARGVYRLPRAERADFQPAAGQASQRASSPAAARPQPRGPQPTSEPAARPKAGARAQGPSTAQSKPASRASPPRAPVVPVRVAKKGAAKRWGGSPSSPKRSAPEPPPAAAAPHADQDGPPPPEIPDWLAEEQQEQAPMGELPVAPSFTRPKKREIRYTWDHVVGSWGYRGRALPPITTQRTKACADALLKVRQEMGECERCGLCERSAHIVFGMGNPSADLVVVGEGPGELEDEHGLPFIGPAGQMLDRMLKGVLGLDREKVYILNIVKCRPPRNRDPKLGEIAACRPFLEAQIRAIAPKVILVLGSPAAKTLLNTTTGITRLRGSWHEWQGIPLRPTLHPAYLLRAPSKKGLAMEDLVALRERYRELGGIQ